MPKKYRKKKRKYTNVLYTLISAVLICATFLLMIGSLYSKFEKEAYEMLHLQTKQIKDDLVLQIKSDRENLVTMANFASKLAADGESYDRMFASFKPIGLFSNIGILNPDNTFVTKVGSVDLNGKISFDEEAKRGEYISGRIPDLTGHDKEIIRSAVPIVSNGKTVGVLYGVIKLDTINKKYKQMASELDAQLFVYDKASGNLVIDTIHSTLGNIDLFKGRGYNDGYSYEELVTAETGYSSFRSVYRNEDLFAHYSTIEDFGWGIMLARYESQVFATADKIMTMLLNYVILIVAIFVIYLLFITHNERRNAVITAKASNIRKLLLEINQQHNSIFEALKNIMTVASSRSSFFVDTDSEEYHYIQPGLKDKALSGEERKYFVSEAFRYAASLQGDNSSTVGAMCIKPNMHLARTNDELYKFLKEHKINDVTFVTITDKSNHVGILGVINAGKKYMARELLTDIAICFSIAIYNKKHLNRTEVAATTDSLTGVPNRVAYKNDIVTFDEDRPDDFSCIYIDVNELHTRNNKYGHAAGDEMLIYIANTLKEVFYGHNIYRMGGDEFLVFMKDTEQEQVKERIDMFIENLSRTDYKVAIGMSYRKQNIGCEEMVREAEIRMYEAKAQYYQNKEQTSVSKNEDKSYMQTRTGILEIDTLISVLKEHYNGIYRVSLDTDNAHRILMPSYLGYNEYEKSFSKLLERYIEEMVHPDFHRSLSSFLNYNAIKRQLLEGKNPRITYKKMNGETVALSIYGLMDNDDGIRDTLWVFSKS